MDREKPQQNSAPRIAAPPPEIAELRAWLIWHRDGKRKVPHYADGGRRHGKQNTPEDLARLVTFDEAREAVGRQGADGVGLALRAELGVVVVDFDHCISEGGKVLPAVESLTLGTVAEISPSGAGLHAFYLGSLEDKKFIGDEYPFAMEVFCGNGFVTYTGNTYGGWDLIGMGIAPLSDAVIAEYRRRAGRLEQRSTDVLMNFEPPVGLTIAQMREKLSWLDPDCSEPEWVRIGWAIGHETSYSEAGRQLWHEWSAGSLRDRPAAKYDEEVAEAKWNGRQEWDGPVVTFRSVLSSANKAQERQEVADKRRRFQVVPADQVMTAKPIPYLVKRVLPHGELGMLFAASGHGKTFLALDLALSVALGRPWRRHRVHQHQVVYVAAEGQAGFGLRIRAYSKRYGIEGRGIGQALGIIADQPNIAEQTDCTALAAEIAEFGDVGLIIVDTLAQTTPGIDENSSEGIGRALANCKFLHRETNAMVLLVHHTGKDTTRGARGWSGMKGAMDVELEIEREGDNRTLRVTKMKDGPGEGDVYGFQLEQVDLGFTDSDGDPVSSMVAVESDVVQGVREPTGKVQRSLLAVIREADEPISEEVVIGRYVEQRRAQGEKVEPKNVRRSLHQLLDEFPKLFDRKLSEGGELLIRAAGEDLQNFTNTTAQTAQNRSKSEMSGCTQPGETAQTAQHSRG